MAAGRRSDFAGRAGALPPSRLWRDSPGYLAKKKRLRPVLRDLPGGLLAGIDKPRRDDQFRGILDVMSSSITSSRGKNSRNPEVGLGVVGTNTLSMSLAVCALAFTSPLVSDEMKPMAQISLRGYWIRQAFSKAALGLGEDRFGDLLDAGIDRPDHRHAVDQRFGEADQRPPDQPLGDPSHDDREDQERSPRRRRGS